MYADCMYVPTHVFTSSTSYITPHPAPTKTHLQGLSVQMLYEVIAAVAQVEHVGGKVNVLLPEVEGPNILPAEGHVPVGCSLEVLAPAGHCQPITWGGGVTVDTQGGDGQG